MRLPAGVVVGATLHDAEYEGNDTPALMFHELRQSKVFTNTMAPVYQKRISQRPNCVREIKQ